MSAPDDEPSAGNAEETVVAAPDAAPVLAKGKGKAVAPPAEPGPTGRAEGLLPDEADEADSPVAGHSLPPFVPGGSGDPGAGSSGSGRGQEHVVDQLKEVIDSLKAALHTERKNAADKDVQVHKLLAERDFVVDEYRRSFAKDVEDLKAQLKREQELNREMETQLQEVLGLWESAAGDARSEAASEVADLRKQLEEARARLADADDARRVQEVKLRNEVDQIMKLWEEAQSTNGAEVEHLQERILELKQQLADTKARLRKAEGSLEEYSF